MTALTRGSWSAVAFLPTQAPSTTRCRQSRSSSSSSGQSVSALALRLPLCLVLRLGLRKRRRSPCAGFPLFYLYLLVKCRRAIRERKPTHLSTATRFLWKEYEAHADRIEAPRDALYRASFACTRMYRARLAPRVQAQYFWWLSLIHI